MNIYNYFKFFGLEFMYVVVEEVFFVSFLMKIDSFSKDVSDEGSKLGY